MTELGISNNRLFLDSYFICFWGENDFILVGITATIDFRLLTQKVSTLNPTLVTQLSPNIFE